MQHISGTSPPFNHAPCKTPCPSVHDPLPLFFKDEVEVYEHPSRLLNGLMDTPPAALSGVAVPHKCSLYSGTPDIAPHPNAFSHETGKGNHNSKGHEVQNAILCIMDQSMCCFENFPLFVTVTEAPLALSFPRHGPDQGTNCHPTPSTGQDSGRLLQTAHALSFPGMVLIRN